MSKHISIQVNDQLIQASEGQTVLECLQANEVEVPTVCYHPSLGAIETCDTCIIQVNGEYVRSCSTTLQSGDRIQTETTDVKKHRRWQWTKYLLIMSCIVPSVILIMVGVKYIIQLKK